MELLARHSDIIVGTLCSPYSISVLMEQPQKLIFSRDDRREYTPAGWQPTRSSVSSQVRTEFGSWTIFSLVSTMQRNWKINPRLKRVERSTSEHHLVGRCIFSGAVTIVVVWLNLTSASSTEVLL